MISGAFVFAAMAGRKLLADKCSGCSNARAGVVAGGGWIIKISELGRLADEFRVEQIVLQRCGGELVACVIHNSGHGWGRKAGASDDKPSAVQSIVDPHTAGGVSIKGDIRGPS